MMRSSISDVPFYPTTSTLERSGLEHTTASKRHTPWHLNPYLTIGGALVGGTLTGYAGAFLRPQPEIHSNTNRERTLEHDGFQYREVFLDETGKAGVLERTATGKNIKPYVRDANPNFKLTFDVIDPHSATATRKPKQLDVNLPIDKTFSYVTTTNAEKANDKNTQQQAKLKGELNVQYVKAQTPEQQHEFTPDITAFSFHDDGKRLALKARVDGHNLTYTDYTLGKPPETKTLDTSTLRDASPHLFLDFRKTLKSQLPEEELVPHPKTGVIKSNSYKRVSVMPVDSKDYTWHPTAVQKLETQFDKAMLAYNGFTSLEGIQADTRLAFKTQGGIVGGMIGLLAGISIWGYSQWKDRQAGQLH
jgi:hypothetical protein